MASPSVAFVSAILLSVLALSHSGVIGDAPFDTDVAPFDADLAPYSIIDPIIKAILESMRPKLANLKIDNINRTIANPGVNGSILVTDILIQNADKFVIKALKSNMVPLKLTNLTLTWNNITASARYNINASVLRKPLLVYAKGTAGAVLRDLFFTIGANIEMKNNAIQIKPKGLFGFDVRIGKANVTLSSLLGSEDLGKTVGVFLSNAIPDLVSTLKKPVFEAFQDDIIKAVNEVLKKNGTSVADEYRQLADDSLDLSEALFGQPLDLDLDLDNEELNFEF